jgi:acetyl-CoA synthetase
VSIPLFLLFGPDALKTRLLDAGAKAVVTDAEGQSLLEPVRADVPELETVVDPEKGIPDGGRFETVETGPDDPAVLIYTSGTTGAPKGALHGHRVLRGHLPGVELSHDLLPQPGDVLWTPADWAWIGGLFDVLMPGLWHGVPVVAARMAKFSSEACLEIIETTGAHNIFFPPTALRMLRAEGANIEGLRSVACGGEPLGADMLAWGQEALGVTINEFYGQTECNMVVSCCGALFNTPPGTTGRAVPGHDVAVLDDTGQPVEGQEGDIAIKRGTPVMFLGYWKNPQETEAKFRGDWMLTGDRGVANGPEIRFVARDDDVITSAGYRLGPAEIEDCLMAHPSVAQVGVTGKPDALRTEIVKAYVVLKPDTKKNAALCEGLKSHVRARLGKHEYPREIEFLDTLPMTVTGKIIRKELRARAAAEVCV